MNKRIKELKHLASVWCDENIPEQWSDEINGYGKGWEDKFAELIVQECIRCCDDVDAIQKHYIKYGIDQELDAKQCIEVIKKHFGVSE